VPHLSIGEGAALTGAAFVAGAINSVAGGGSFITFPALIFSGVTPLRANTTNTVAVWFGTVASVGAYHRQLEGQPRHAVLTLMGTSLAGGLVGALLLLHTPDAVFRFLLPWLMLVATLIFIAGPIVTRVARKWVHLDLQHPKGFWPHVVAATMQLSIAVYGGFFGGGIGILMLALLTLLGYAEIHVMNALKTVLASTINGIAVVAFVVANTVDWPRALVMIVGGVLGGYLGALFAQRTPPAVIRGTVMVIGLGMTAYFFWKTP
jgi:uncharacterized membrane protein YfcA